uniref:Uncharacterized protein n=1 Tax=Siphoviridae sp. ctS1E53 TaxID=2826340 RepID=A0A8S5MF42_9CAUD|nr:MAG TPA: hypothetical protein [Siphoviridae sp. ctS1E53]
MRQLIQLFQYPLGAYLPDHSYDLRTIEHDFPSFGGFPCLYRNPAVGRMQRIRHTNPENPKERGNPACLDKR